YNPGGEVDHPPPLLLDLLRVNPRSHRTPTFLRICLVVKECPTMTIVMSPRYGNLSVCQRHQHTSRPPTGALNPLSLLLLHLLKRGEANHLGALLVHVLWLNLNQ